MWAVGACAGMCCTAWAVAVWVGCRAVAVRAIGVWAGCVAVAVWVVGVWVG